MGDESLFLPRLLAACILACLLVVPHLRLLYTHSLSSFLPLRQRFAGLIKPRDLALACVICPWDLRVGEREAGMMAVNALQRNKCVSAFIYGSKDDRDE